MTDIVERLRTENTLTGYYDPPQLQADAADEIERLRAERDMWRQENVKKQIACEQMGARIVALEAERDAARVERDEAQRLVNQARGERDEAIAALALYRAENGCTRGQRTTQWCGEASKLRRAWLRVIQTENSCPPSGGGCLAKRCGCVAEMQMLIEEAAHE